MYASRMALHTEPQDRQASHEVISPLKPSRMYNPGSERTDNYYSMGKGAACVEPVGCTMMLSVLG